MSGVDRQSITGEVLLDTKEPGALARERVRLGYRAGIAARSGVVVV